MDSLQNILQSKADSLSDNKRDDVALVQIELDRIFPDEAKAFKIVNNMLFIHTQSSSIASEIRWQQLDLLRIFNAPLKTELEAIRVQIR